MKDSVTVERITNTRLLDTVRTHKYPHRRSASKRTHTLSRHGLAGPASGASGSRSVGGGEGRRMDGAGRDGWGD